MLCLWQCVLRFRTPFSRSPPGSAGNIGNERADRYANACRKSVDKKIADTGVTSGIVDDEREQIGLAKSLGHSIGAIAQAIGRPNRRSRSNSPAISCRVDATRRFTPPEPINCAGGVKR